MAAAGQRAAKEPSHWRGPGAARDTLAFGLALSALAVATVAFLGRGRDITGWTSAVGATLMFAGAVAWTGRYRWIHRVVFGCGMLVSWWQLYRVTSG